MQDKTRITWSKRTVSIVILLSALLATTTTLARVSLQDSDTFYLPLQPYTSYLIDDSLRLEAKELSKQAQLFEPVATPHIDFGLTEARVWLRVELANKESKPGVWRMDINRQYNAEIQVHLKVEDELPKRILYNTENMPFSARPLEDALLGVDFELAANTNAEIYVGYRSNSTTYLPIGIGTPQAVNEQHNNEHQVNALMNGALLAMVAFALLIGAAIGWSLSLSFCIYIVAGMAYVFNADGYTFKYLWPEQPQLNDPMNMALMLMMSFFALNFALRMFNFKKTSPRLGSTIVAMMGLALGFALAAVPFLKVNWVMVVGYSLVPVVSLMQCVAGFAALRLKLLGAVPFFLGALIVLSSMLYAAIAHAVPGYFDLDHTLDYGHFALMSECLAFAFAIAQRMLGIRAERDRAMKSEVETLQDKLRLASALQESQSDYIAARRQSDLRRAQLANVSHDIQQPLTSLRRAINQIDGTNEDTIEKMHSAFDYLETLATTQLESSNNSSSDLRDEDEVFPLDIILDNVREMFANEAQERKLTFRHRTTDVIVKTNPLGLMRCVSNLMANAINHTEHGSILLAARKRGTKVRIEIWNTGEGMTEDQIEQYMNPGVKRADSKGSGLGLSIVREIAEKNGYDFKIESKRHIGTRASLSLGIAESRVSLKSIPTYAQR